MVLGSRCSNVGVELLRQFTVEDFYSLLSKINSFWTKGSDFMGKRFVAGLKVKEPKRVWRMESPMATRELLYTAITQAKRMVYVAGNLGSVRKTGVTSSGRVTLLSAALA